MTNVPTEKYAPLATIDGDRLGFDSAGYLVGRGFKGLRTSTFEGRDVKLAGPIVHNEQFDDFIGPVLSSARWGTKLGSDGANAVAITPSVGGAIRFTTGGNAAHSVATNGAVLQSALNWKAANGGLVFEARVGAVSSLTGLVLYMGFTDQIASLAAPFTLSVATLTSNASNGTGFLFDAAQTTPHFNLVGVKGDTDATTQNLTVDPATSGYHTYRVAVDSTGNARFFIDGLLVGTTLANAVTATTALTPVICVSSESTAARTVDCDYVLVQQFRV